MESIQIRCAHCERIDTADIADFDALAAALGQDTTADTQEEGQ